LGVEPRRRVRVDQVIGDQRFERRDVLGRHRLHALLVEVDDRLSVACHGVLHPSMSEHAVQTMSFFAAMQPTYTLDPPPPGACCFSRAASRALSSLATTASLPSITASHCLCSAASCS